MIKVDHNIYDAEAKQILATYPEIGGLADQIVGNFKNFSTKVAGKEFLYLGATSDPLLYTNRLFPYSLGWDTLFSFIDLHPSTVSLYSVIQNLPDYQREQTLFNPHVFLGDSNDNFLSGQKATLEQYCSLDPSVRSFFTDASLTGKRNLSISTTRFALTITERASSPTEIYILVPSERGLPRPLSSFIIQTSHFSLSEEDQPVLEWMIEVLLRQRTFAEGKN